MKQEDIRDVVVDTSFINSLMDKNDLNHDKVKDFFSKNQYKYHSPEFLLIELSSFFERKYGYNMSDDIVYAVKKFINLHPNYSKIDTVILAIKKYKTRGTDSLFVRLADKLNYQLITCDKDQAKKYDKSICI